MILPPIWRIGGVGVVLDRGAGLPDDEEQSPEDQLPR
jgi:hypothetical protein